MFTFMKIRNGTITDTKAEIDTEKACNSARVWTQPMKMIVNEYLFP